MNIMEVSKEVSLSVCTSYYPGTAVVEKAAQGQGSVIKSRVQLHN